MIHPDDRDETVERFLGIPDLGDHVRVEFRVVDEATGRVRWVEETATNLLEEPAVGAVVGNLRDVTDRHAAEDAVRFQARLLDAVGQAVVAIDNGGRITYWNDTAQRIYGWSPDEAIGRPISEVLPVAAEEREVARHVHDRLQRGEGWAGEITLVSRDGARIHVAVTDTPVFDKDGNQIGSIGVSADVTEQVELRDRVEEERQRLADAQASAHLGSFEIDMGTGRVVRSEEMLRLLALDPDEHGDDPFSLEHVHPDDVADVEDALRRAVAGEHVEVVHRVVHPDGSVRWLHTRTSQIREGEHGIVILGTSLDITERHEAERALEHQATHDPLTGLPNRTGLARTLGDLLEERAGRSEVAVAFVDLDQFKVINDSLGHAVGDRTLVAVTDRLRRCARPGDVVGRFGGDEFVVLRPDVPDLSGAAELASLIHACLEDPLRIEDWSFDMSASIGVALSETGSSAASLLRDADAAMYQAKADGRARSAVFDSRSRARAYRRLTLDTALPQALDHGELHVEYQPVLRLADGSLAGFEALVRWTHPHFGRISPEEFIPIAEGSGLISRIGRWVLGTALDQLAEWNRGRTSPVWMAVNVSAQQLGGQDLADTVRRTLAEAGVDPPLLHLEVTESVLMERVENSMSTFLELRDLGVGMSIDDFGTGYSSLSYLGRLPIDTLKVDRSFVHLLGDGDGHARSIVRAVTALAGSLRLELVAEGIEQRVQLEVLRDLGCQMGQGFLWSPAVGASEATDWVRAGGQPRPEG